MTSKPVRITAYSIALVSIGTSFTSFSFSPLLLSSVTTHSILFSDGPVISGVVASYVAAKFIFLTLFRGSPRLTSNSLSTWGVWIAICACIWTVGFVIAELIPFFSDLLSIISSVLTVWFTYGLSGVLWLYDNGPRHSEGGRGKGYTGYFGSTKAKVNFGISVFVIVMSAVIMVLGMYSAIKSIAQNVSEASVIIDHVHTMSLVNLDAREMEMDVDGRDGEFVSPVERVWTTADEELGLPGKSQEVALGTLHGTHKDVDAFRDLLTGVYGYQEDEVVVMKDERRARRPNLVPTQDNIRRELHKLVRAAEPGDHFVLLFAGHSIQQDAVEDTQEEDGKDEVIITSDEKKIVDNELKEILVDNLPPGCNLIAIFDTCHSGTLLDLPHHSCNQIYVPWISKGTRRTKTLQSTTTRRLTALVPRRPNSRSNAAIGSLDALAEITNTKRRHMTIDTMVHHPSDPSAHSPCRSMSASENKPVHNSFSSVSSSSSPSRLALKPHPRTRVPTIQFDSIQAKVDSEITLTTPRRPLPERKSRAFRGGDINVKAENSVMNMPTVTSPIQCESPPSFFECDGWCPEVGDASRSRGENMTDLRLGVGVVVSVLGCSAGLGGAGWVYDAGPLQVSDFEVLYKLSTQLHQWTHERKKEVSAKSVPPTLAQKEVDGEMNAFQAPVVSLIRSFVDAGRCLMRILCLGS
ncbi:hypothetical protein EW146_g9899 [Bondarzewia mesenterica]|uniref:Peptidase C14 caspase domain-containing protein n=1 Tax=Bondarzewia mesenterica TaxID=1095465 RepID=A0A4S4L739_9AGAM|nr:hypothetical protein EW146_g9899 [Bondarzewia mesenterica]